MEDHPTLKLLLEQSKWLTREMEQLRRDVRDLRDFKWKVVGVSLALAFVANILIEVVRAGAK